MNDGAVTIVYDGDGRRVGKTVGGVTTRYLVDDRNPTHLPQVVEEIVNGMRSAWQRIALGGGAGAVLGAGSALALRPPYAAAANTLFRKVWTMTETEGPRKAIGSLHLV